MALPIAWPLVARAQQSAMPRVGYIWSGAPGTDVSNAGLRQGLTDRGYVIGGNLVLEERYAEGNPERIPALIAELLALNIDVLVTPGTPITLAAKLATTTVPIVCLSGKSSRLRLSGQLVSSGRQYHRHVAVGRLQRKMVGVAHQGGSEIAPRCGAVEPRMAKPAVGEIDLNLGNIAAAPSGSRTRSPRSASGSSAPDQSRACRCASSKVQAPCAPSRDRERRRSDAPGDRAARPCRGQTNKRTVLVHLPVDPS